MSVSESTVRAAIAGDLRATEGLVAAPRQDIVRLARSMGTLTVTAAATTRVLLEAAARPERAAAAAAWSRLARNGLLQPGSADYFSVAYDPHCEDAVAEAVLRLDDLLDLPIGADELAELPAALAYHHVGDDPREGA